MLWAITIVELTVPTEKVVGAFPTAQDAVNWIEAARHSGKEEREKWQQVSVLPMEDPDAAG